MNTLWRWAFGGAHNATVAQLAKPAVRLAAFAGVQVAWCRDGVATVSDGATMVSRRCHDGVATVSRWCQMVPQGATMVPRGV